MKNKRCAPGNCRRAGREAPLTPDLPVIGERFVFDGMSCTMRTKGFRNAAFSIIRTELDLQQQAYELRLRSRGIAADPLYREHRARRSAMLAGLLSRGVQSRYFDRELFTGELSPACVTCPSDGFESRRNIFTTVTCNRKCFFCPTDPEASIGGVGDMREFFENGGKLNCLSFTGGEPLLEYEKVLKAIRDVKELSRGKCYTYFYTNGFLFTRQKLAALRAAGLREIRINIAAGDYWLDPVRLAREYIENVIVEVPAIPEDRDRLERLLPEIESLKLRGIVLHELLCYGRNAEQYRKRGYLLKEPGVRPFYLRQAVPILGSEEAAYRIFAGALDRGIKTHIHYCSGDLKQLFQTRNRDYYHLKGLLPPHRALLRSGLSCSLLVGSGDKDAVLKDVKGMPGKKLKLDDRFVELHPSALPRLRPRAYEIALCLRHFDTITDIGVVERFRARNGSR